MTASQALADAGRVVIKIGSAQLMDGPTGRPRHDRFDALAKDLAELKTSGKEVLLVSSGAVGLGRQSLSADKPKTLSLVDKQAAAAIGQPRLIELWQRAFTDHGLTVAQMLLSPSDIEARARWLNARNTAEKLLDLGIIPILNENDSVATEELRFGDNDRLAARIAQLVSADLLLILSDVEGLYDRDPAQSKDARLIPVIETLTEDHHRMAGDIRPGSSGTGGMRTKLAAAAMASSAGCATILTSGLQQHPVSALKEGAPSTLIKPVTLAVKARQSWLRGALVTSGAIHVDQGAARALKGRNSLLPAGVTHIEGHFQRGDTVRVCSQDGREIALGLVGYDSHEAALIAGRNTLEIETLLGYRRGSTLIHADDLVLLEAIDDHTH